MKTHRLSKYLSAIASDKHDPATVAGLARKHAGGWFEQGQQQQQTNANNQVQGWHALASVTGGNPPVFLRQRGFTAIARTSAGIYVLTMQDALDIVGGDGIILCTNNGTFAVGATAQASPTTASTITVTLATVTAVPAAAAADISFWLGVLPIGPN